MRDYVDQATGDTHQWEPPLVRIMMIMNLVT